MNAAYSKRVFGSYSDNPKPVLSFAEGSAIQKRPRGPKWMGILAIAFSGAVVEAQQPGKKLARIGVLRNDVPSTFATRREAFLQGLRDLGYVEGKNVEIEYRYAEGKRDRWPDIAADMVRLKTRRHRCRKHWVNRCGETSDQHDPDRCQGRW